MRLTIKTLKLTLGLCVVASVAALATVAVIGSARDTVAVIGSGDLNTPLLDSTRASGLGIELDVDANAAVQSKVTRDEATAVARSVRPLGERVEVYHGRTWRYQDGPMLSVWIVVTEGGRAPSWGAPGGEPLDTAMTGVIVDDTTGEFVRGFLTSP